MVSSLGSSKMLAAEIEDVVEVFLDEVPEMPESAESFLVKCLPGRKRGIFILFVPRRRNCAVLDKVVVKCSEHAQLISQLPCQSWHR